MWLNTFFFLSGFKFFHVKQNVLTFKFYFKKLSSPFLHWTSRLAWVASRRERDLWRSALRLSLATLQSQLSRRVRSKMGDTLWRTITQRCDESTTGRRPQKKEVKCWCGLDELSRHLVNEHNDSCVILGVGASDSASSLSSSSCIWVRVMSSAIQVFALCVKCMYVSEVTTHSWPDRLEIAPSTCDTLLVENKILHSSCALSRCLARLPKKIIQLHFETPHWAAKT